MSKWWQEAFLELDRSFADAFRPKTPLRHVTVVVPPHKHAEFLAKPLPRKLHPKNAYLGHRRNVRQRRVDWYFGPRDFVEEFEGLASEATKILESIQPDELPGKEYILRDLELRGFDSARWAFQVHFAAWHLQASSPHQCTPHVWTGSCVTPLNITNDDALPNLPLISLLPGDIVDASREIIMLLTGQIDGRPSSMFSDGSAYSWHRQSGSPVRTKDKLARIAIQRRCAAAESGQNHGPSGSIPPAHQGDDDFFAAVAKLHEKEQKAYSSYHWAHAEMNKHSLAGTTKKAVYCFIKEHPENTYPEDDLPSEVAWMKALERAEIKLQNTKPPTSSVVQRNDI